MIILNIYYFVKKKCQIRHYSLTNSGRIDLSLSSPKTSSKYIGVTKLKDGKWQASISYKSKNIYIGRYNTEVEAHQAYIKKHKELYGNEVHCQINVIGE